VQQHSVQAAWQCAQGVCILLNNDINVDYAKVFEKPGLEAAKNWI